MANTRHASALIPIILFLNLFLIIASLAATFCRNSTWLNDVSLYEDVTKKSYYKLRVHLNLGKAYKSNNLLNRAIEEYALVIKNYETYSDLSEAYNNLGRVYEQMGDLDMALKAYGQAIKYDPHSSVAFNNLGLIYLQRNELDTAIKQFRASIFYSPDYAKAHLNLARALAVKGDNKEAEREMYISRKLGIAGGN